MKSFPINVHSMKKQITACICCLSMLCLGMAAKSQLAEEGINDLGNKYKIYIYSKQSLGEGKWRFQTKTVGETLSKPHYSSWQEADCWNSSIDGKIIGAVKILHKGRGGGHSNAGILQAVCGH